MGGTCPLCPPDPPLILYYYTLHVIYYIIYHYIILFIILFIIFIIYYTYYISHTGNFLNKPTYCVSNVLSHSRKYFKLHLSARVIYPNVHVQAPRAGVRYTIIDPIGKSGPTRFHLTKGWVSS